MALYVYNLKLLGTALVNLKLLATAGQKSDISEGHGLRMVHNSGLC